ncbi:hypothetical protein [Treponema medium]|uniref:hypothetical protein n=1 Tax=Treponema medium TaxID=58231 RepID=UPI00197F6917|nr:hypothetical protein [Treponema medium]
MNQQPRRKELLFGTTAVRGGRWTAGIKPSARIMPTGGKLFFLYTIRGRIDGSVENKKA